jgi:hypothetical protein
MNGKKAVYQFDKRPIVWVKLENPHDPSALPIEVPALIDTGADTSAVPAQLCPLLGHSFENGISESFASGIGKGKIRTFVHSTKLTVLFPKEAEGDVSQTFETIEFPCDFIEQTMPFVLLGQRDFLRMFRYAQDGHAGWFSLEQIMISDAKQ